MAETKVVEIENAPTVKVDRGTPMLTTIDNPFNPFTQFSEWLLFDNRNEHNCCAYLGRAAGTSPALTPHENQIEIEEAIDRLLEADFLHIYKKVYADDFQ